MKLILFSFLFLILCLPFFQERFHIFSLKKLEGVEINNEPGILTKDLWFEGTFQKDRELAINKTVGMRELLIRIFNQYDFSLFHVSYNSGVVIGKNDYMYQVGYIDNHTGKNFIGWYAVQSITKRFKLLQESLKKKDIDLFLVLAPGKASYYPEFVPDHEYSQNTNNHRAFKSLLLKYDVNFIDLLSWFNEMKGNTPYKLYPRYGVHWSYYGAYLAADTIKKYIENIHHCKLPEIRLDRVVISDTLRQPDYDMGELLNLFTRLKDTMPYPVMSYLDKADQNKPTGLLISDSYGWQWNEQDFLMSIFSDWSFWFYNNTMYPESKTKTKTTKEIDYPTVLQTKKVIIVMACEATLDRFPYGLLDMAERIYIPQTRKELSGYFKIKMFGDNSWLQNVKRKAIQKNISMEESIQDEADYLASQTLDSSEVNTVQYFEKKIRNNEEWFTAVKKKAIEKNISVDEMIRIDAEWMVQQKSPSK